MNGETVTAGVNIVKLQMTDFEKIDLSASVESARNGKTRYVSCPCVWRYKGYNEKNLVSIPLLIPVASLYATLSRFYGRYRARDWGVRVPPPTPPEWLVIVYKPSEYNVWAIQEGDIGTVMTHVNDLKYLNGLLPGIYRFYTGLELVTFGTPLPIHPPNHQGGRL